MKKYLITTFISIFFGSGAIAQGWNTVDLPTTATITGIDFLTTDTAFLCTNDGEMAYSSDGGQNWQMRRVSFDANLQSIDFVNSKIGVVCGQAGLAYRTTDGGENWEQVLPVDSSRTLISVEFFDNSTGMIIGMDKSDDNPYRGLAMHTTDGGKTWEELPQMGMGFSELFYSEQNGVLFPAFGQIIRSHDKGASFDHIRIAEVSLGRDITAYGNTILVVGPGGFIVVSTDGGETWQEHKQDPKAMLLAAVILDENTAFTGGANSVMLMTTDRGATWSKELLPRSMSVHDMAYAGGKVWAVGTNGAIAYKQIR